MACKFRQPKVTYFDFDCNVKKNNNKIYWYKKKRKGWSIFEKKRKQRVCLKGRIRQVSRCNEELFFFYFLLSILGLYQEVKQPLDRVCDDRRHCAGPRCLDKPSKHGK